MLLVAYHFVPDNASGTHRSVHFARSLERAGYRPFVLTVTEDILTCVDPSLSELFPFPDRVVRARPRRTIGDVYVSWKRRWERGNGRIIEQRSDPTGGTRSGGWLTWLRRQVAAWDAFPDLQRSWYRPAVRAGLELARKERLCGVYTSAPPWTALHVGRAIAERVGCVLISDLRDPWTVNSGANPSAQPGWAAWLAQRWEARILQQSGLVLFSSRQTMETARRNYANPGFPPFQTILNGSDVPRRELAAPFPSSAPLTVRHFGSMYGGRSVTPLLSAVAQLIRQGVLQPKEFLLEFIGPELPGAEQLQGLALELGVGLRLVPTLPFRDAVLRMSEPALLLVVQPARFAGQIPTKLYDYLCTGNPILVLAPAQSATWAVATRFSRCWRLDDGATDANATILGKLLARWRSGELQQERTLEDTAELTKEVLGERFVDAIAAATERRARKCSMPR